MQTYIQMHRTRVYLYINASIRIYSRKREREIKRIKKIIFFQLNTINKKSEITNKKKQLTEISKIITTYIYIYIFSNHRY